MAIIFDFFLYLKIFLLILNKNSKDSYGNKLYEDCIMLQTEGLLAQVQWKIICDYQSPTYSLS